MVPWANVGGDVGLHGAHWELDFYMSNHFYLGFTKVVYGITACSICLFIVISIRL